MKQRELIKKLQSVGFEFQRHGEITIYIEEVMMKNRFLDIKK